MRLHARVWILTLICGVLLVGTLASAASAAEFPLIEKLVATNCVVSTCGQENILGPFFEPKASISTAEAKAEGETQAGGRTPFGITDFKVLTLKEVENEKGEKVPASYATGTVEPTSVVEHLRTDVAPGLATNPFAVPMCTSEQFGNKEAIPGTGFFTAVSPECKESEIGEQFATVFGGFPKQTGFEKATGAGDLPLSGKVYDLEAGGEETMANGAKLAALYGVALELPKPLTEAILGGIFKGSKPTLEKEQYFAHTLIKGSVEWGKEARGTGAGDFHDYFEIHVSPALPLVRSRLVFKGTVGDGGFITNATSCPGHLTTSLHMTDKEGIDAPVKTFTTPIGLEGCDELEFPVNFAFTQANTLSDKPTEFSAEVSEEHEPEETDVSQVKSASITLPEGMTLNPSAAHGLEACSTGQAHQEGTVFGEKFGVECPEGSKIGTVSLNVPTLPDGSLTGNVYLGGPAEGPITGPPYNIYVVANSAKFGISVRLLGETVPNEATGQLTAFFRNPPEQPFTSIKMTFDRSVLAPVANPLVCGTRAGAASFEPTSAPGTSKNDPFGISVTGCPVSLPFSLAQSTENETENGGGHTSFAINYSRGDGNQYLQKIKTTLPPGVVGAIPAVTQCGEAPANAGTCAASSKIGTATVQAGSGPAPFTFSGPVYLTGPYQGAPYGLSIAVPAVAGPFNLGTVVTRGTLRVDQTTAQVTAESTLPTIFKGIPLRLRNINVNTNRQGFLFNPTNCSPLATVSTLSSTEGATQTLSTPFQVANCSALPFTPKFTATTSAKASRVNGASLVTTLTQGSGQANITSVKVQLPKQLPSRLTSLQKACLAAVFDANPANCAATSSPGTATAVTPTLPGKMTGKAYFVSHGGGAFPDLDLVLEDQGVKVILVGNTDIKKSITTTTFASTPDVPVTSVTVNLPTGPHSALAAFGNLCVKPLVMPTTITGQNGKTTKKNTIIGVSNCGVQIVGHKVVGRTVFLTVKTFAAGRITGSGKGLGTARRSLNAASRAVTLKVPLRHGKPFKTKVKVSFTPKRKGARSSATVTVRFR
jgi:hypothetical protein